jgi:hypothetical protein
VFPLAGLQRRLRLLLVGHIPKQALDSDDLTDAIAQRGLHHVDKPVAAIRPPMVLDGFQKAA